MVENIAPRKTGCRVARSTSRTRTQAGQEAIAHRLQLREEGARHRAGRGHSRPAVHVMRLAQQPSRPIGPRQHAISAVVGTDPGVGVADFLEVPSPGGDAELGVDAEQPEHEVETGLRVSAARGGRGRSSTGQSRACRTARSGRSRLCRPRCGARGRPGGRERAGGERAWVSCHQGSRVLWAPGRGKSRRGTAVRRPANASRRGQETAPETTARAPRKRNGRAPTWRAADR